MGEYLKIVIGHLKNRHKILNRKMWRKVLQEVMLSVPWQKAGVAKPLCVLSAGDYLSSMSLHCRAALL